jgi:hypothetical protein
MDAVTAAFSGLFDYAGLFPPAGLPLDAVGQRYGSYRGGRHAWMLGRLIVPAERLAEAERVAATCGATPDCPWPLSVLVGTPQHGAAFVEDIAERRQRPSSVRVEAIEAVATSGEEVATLAAQWPDGERFVEIPYDRDPAALMTALSAHGLSAKIRAGGITTEKFPTTAEAARFLARARAANVALKATAGLHHAIRGDYRLTYTPESDTGTMHGFVNLVLAATLLMAGKIDEDLVDACLDDDRADAFKISGRAGSWLNGVVTYSEVAHARRSLLRSVGTCSFEEPVAEIEALDFGLKGVDGA